MLRKLNNHNNMTISKTLLTLLLIPFIVLTFALESLSDELPIVTSIEVKGLRRIEEGSIRVRISQKIGEQLSAEKTSDDIKAINKMGYFDDVRVEIAPFEGGIKLIYTVKEKPTIVSLEFSGNKEFDDDKLKEKTTITAGAIADYALITENAAKIRSLYYDDGYYLVQVVPVLKTVNEGEVNLVYLINEGKKVKIKDIVFVGNKALSERELKKVMANKEYFFLKFWGGYFKKDELKIDMDRIKDLYYKRGFIKAVIQEPKVEISEDKKDITITVTISEGSQYKVSSVDIKGNTAFETKELLELIKLKPGQIFNKDVVAKDIKALTDKYTNNGYALASVFPDILPDEQTNETPVIYTIEEGSKYTINRINISGNTKTRDKVIRREMRLDEGDIFSAEKIKRSEERIKNLQFFETVDITQKPNAEDLSVDLDVKVKEKPTGFLTVGGGYSSVDKLVVMADITQGNLLGSGYMLKLKGELGAKSSFYEISFRDPYFMDKPISMTTGIYRSYRDYDNYDRKSIGAHISFGRQFWEYWSASIGYAIDYSTVYNVRPDSSQYVLEQAGKNITSSIGYSVWRDTRDNYLDPTKGTSIGLYGTFAGLGGNTAFMRENFDAGWWRPVGEDYGTFHLRARLGHVMGIFGRTLPLYEKYYVGGLNTVRGLGYGDGGPKDPQNNEPIGGTSQIIFNAEYIFPIVEELRFKGVVFFDMGRAYGDGEGFLSDMRRTTGFGFRWISPIGPLRIEWGKNLAPKYGEASSKWDFTIGAPF